MEKVIFLDLFSGTGSMGLEALSRGAEQAYFVENNRPSLEILRKNIELTGTQAQTRVLPLDAKRALQYLGKNRESFEIIYVDPPYNLPDITGILDIIYREELLKNGGLIGVERSSRLSSRPGGFELGKTPFFLWKKKFYGNTLLLIFKNEQISAPNEINPKGGI